MCTFPKINYHHIQAITYIFIVPLCYHRLRLALRPQSPSPFMGRRVRLSISNWCLFIFSSRLFPLSGIIPLLLLKNDDNNNVNLNNPYVDVTITKLIHNPWLYIFGNVWSLYTSLSIIYVWFKPDSLQTWPHTNRTPGLNVPTNYTCLITLRSKTLLVFISKKIEN